MTSNGLLTIDQRQLSANYHLVAATDGLMDLLPERSFYTYVCNFIREAVRLPKHTVIAHTTKSPTAIHDICKKNPRGYPLGTPEEHERVHQIPDEVATRGTAIQSDKAAVHCKPTENLEPHMSRHQVVRNYDSKRLSEDWCMEVQVSEKYTQYQERFISMLFNFQLLLDGH